MERGEAPPGAVTPVVAGSPGRRADSPAGTPGAAPPAPQIFRFSDFQFLTPPQRGRKDAEKLPSCHPPWDRGGTGRPPFSLLTEGHPLGSS